MITAPPPHPFNELLSFCKRNQTQKKESNRIKQKQGKAMIGLESDKNSTEQIFEKKTEMPIKIWFKYPLSLQGLFICYRLLQFL